MDFFTETKGKIKAMKEGLKRTVKPVACLAIGAVMSSCSTGYTTSSTITTSYLSGNTRVIQTNTIRQSDRDAARANRDNAAAFRNVTQGMGRLARDLKYAFR